MPIFEILLAIIVVILVHELGHATAAILCGIKVLKLSIGFGPGLTFKKVSLLNEVKLGLIIFGGYTVFDNDEMEKRPCWQKEIVYFGGILANILAACLFLWLAGVPFQTSIAYPFSFVATGWPALVEFLISDDHANKLNNFIDYFASFMNLANGNQSFCITAAFMSVTLAMFNSLPILPLDGGHMFVTFLEKIWGGPLKNLRIIYTIIGVILIFVIIFF